MLNGKTVLITGSSETNDHWLTVGELERMIDQSQA